MDTDWSDEATLRQQYAIAEDVSASQPLIGLEEDPISLIEAYRDNVGMLSKLQSFRESYSAIRRCRGDGSCFYRSFLFGIGAFFVRAGVQPPGQLNNSSTHMNDAQRAYEELLVIASESLSLLLAFGYPDVTVPDFYETFKAFLDSFAAAGATVEAVAESLRDPFTDMSCITYLVRTPLYPLIEWVPNMNLGEARSALSPPLTARNARVFPHNTPQRCLCSAELLSHEDEYFPFIAGQAPHCTSIKQFCDMEVDPARHDADQVQMMALCNALRVNVTIACEWAKLHIFVHPPSIHV